MSRWIKAEYVPAETASPTAAPRVIAGEIFAAERRAEEIVARAETRAVAILAAAEEEARLRSEAAVEGVTAACLARWQERYGRLSEARREVLERARPQVVEMALAIAAKLLRQSLEIDPSLVEAAFVETLELLPHRSFGRLVMTVHPDDAEVARGLRQRLLERHPRWEVLSVAVDDGLSRGGCVLETEFGQIDASLETQATAIRRVLLQPEDEA
ncbi:MAG: FliH/SctL family protein [Acidobacteriota bacterium]